MTRLNPRRAVPVRVWPWAPSPERTPAWTGPIDALAVYDPAPQTTADLTPRGRLLVAPQPPLPGPLLQTVQVHSRVEVSGLALTVTGVADHWSRRRPVFTELTLADPLPTHLGWVVAVTVTDGGGLDDDNNPLPPRSRTLPRAVIVPVGSLEPDDQRQDPASDAHLYLPAGESIPSTAWVDVTGCPMPSRWQVIGDPDITPTRTVITLHR